MTGEYFSYNQGTFYYEVNGNGEVIVFLHGFSLDHSMWDSQIKALKAQYKTITYDLRGFGKSTLPTDGYSNCDDLKALLEHLNINAAHIVGLSMGGRVAIDFSLEYPDYVKTLTLAGSAIGGFQDSMEYNIPNNLSTIEDSKNNWLNHDLFLKTRENLEVLNKLKEIVNNYHGWHLIHNDPYIVKNKPAINYLNEIKIPTNIVIGKDDLPYFQKCATELKKRIENSQLHYFDNAGHMINMEAPTLFNQCLLEFLQLQIGTS